MVNQPRVPGPFDARANRRHGTSRFAGDNQGPHRCAAQVDPFLVGQSRQMERVAGRAADDGHLFIADELQPSEAAELTAISVHTCR